MKTVLMLGTLLSAAMASAATVQQSPVVVVNPKFKTSSMMTTQSVKMTSQVQTSVQSMKSNVQVQKSVSAARGSEGVGGGDPSEMRFMDIAANLAEWIRSGNDDQLILPMGYKQEDYHSKMLAALSAYHISFTNSPIHVDGYEKTCRNWKSHGERYIQCNSKRFIMASADMQYQLVHHEFASLEKFEPNDREDSGYLISYQLSQFFGETVVTRLPVQKVEDPKSAYSDCISIAQDASVVTLSGRVSIQKLSYADGQIGTVEVLVLDQPICVTGVDAKTGGDFTYKYISEVQIGNLIPPGISGLALSVKGLLLSYHLEKDAEKREWLLTSRRTDTYIAAQAYWPNQAHEGQN